ncbi:hypothetical protein K440DRAFT_356686 [Wilcoxina mikolae CBS 423.85]|nr:hypothetical protein K440DRAFT_356686 [Wilcoxina mikolae CBS 423.85]
MRSAVTSVCCVFMLRLQRDAPMACQTKSPPRVLDQEGLLSLRSGVDGCAIPINCNMLKDLMPIDVHAPKRPQHVFYNLHLNPSAFRSGQENSQ